MRNMSFFLTTQQIVAQTKTQTRRFNWHFLKAGDVLNAVVKCQGLKKGETISKLATIKVTAIRTEPLNAITKADCIKEGFPDFEPVDFVNMLVKHYKCKPNEQINVIDFEYMEDYEK